MKLLFNIKTKITLWYLLATAVLIVFFGLVAHYLMADGLARKTIAPWEIKIAQTEKSPDGSNQVTGFTDITQMLGLEQDGIIIAKKGFDSSQLFGSVGQSTIQIGELGGEPISIDTTLLSNSGLPQDYQIWFYAFASKNNPQDYQLLTIYQSTDNVFTMNTFRRTVIIAGTLTLVIAGIIGFFLVTRMLRPIKTIARTAKEIGEKNLKQRLKTESNDELGELSSILNQMFERLETAFNHERQFTAEVSHHLRTPLAIAQGEATLALRGERSPEEYRRTIETISREISRLTFIINRLLFLAHSENNMDLVLSEVNIKNLLTELVSDVEVISDEKKISLRLDGPENLVLKGDKMRLRELFLNLLDNAIWYTPPAGKITISLSLKANYALVTVTDTGIGIAEDHIPNLFKRFYRVDKSSSRNEGGAGLGLAICKRIVDLHHGKIEVKSEVGRGSTFSVYLPRL